MIDSSFLVQAIFVIIGVIVLNFLIDVVFYIIFTNMTKSKESKEQGSVWKEFQVRQETHGKQLYWYDVETGMFLAQGADHDELIEKMKIRFPEKTFEITK